MSNTNTTTSTPNAAADLATLQAEIARLTAANALLMSKGTKARATSLKVSDKGGVSVYGLGRFPVTLYKEQWLKLLAIADEIRAFITEHAAELKSKDDAVQ